MDASNPAPAEVIPSQLSTIGAQFGGKPQQETFSDVQPIQQETFSNVAPIPESAKPEPSFWDRFKHEDTPEDVTLKRELSGGASTITGIPKAVLHAFTEPPTDEERAQFGGDVDGAKRVGLAIHRLTTAPIEVAGKWYSDAFKGKLGDASAVEQQLLENAPEALGGAGVSVLTGKAIEAAPGATSEAVQNTKAALTGETAGKIAATGKVLGASAEELPLIGSSIKAAKKLGAIRDIWAPDPTKTNVPYAGEEEPPVTAQPAPKPAPPPVAPKVTRAAVQSQLEQALGASPSPVKPGQPIAVRPAGNTVPASAKGLPEGFTPVQSSALKGYKYNPTTEEFDAITNTGQRFRHAGVTQNQVDAFEAADSKGTAWNELRNGPGVTPLGKVVNGKLQPRIPTQRSAAPEEPTTLKDLSGSGSPKASGDLTDILTKTMEQGVQTTAVPQNLLKRWGVDEQSFAEGRAQTRGMKADESVAAINKLTQRYKNGEAVDPVIETRDADNNIVDVDGRGRALAAQRAGVKRIPIIVRRVPQTQ